MKKRMTNTTIPAELVSISSEEETLAKWGRGCCFLRWLSFLSNLISCVGNLYALDLAIRRMKTAEVSVCQLLWISPSLIWYLSLYVCFAICFGIALRKRHQPSGVSFAVAVYAYVLLRVFYLGSLEKVPMNVLLRLEKVPMNLLFLLINAIYLRTLLRSQNYSCHWKISKPISRRGMEKKGRISRYTYEELARTTIFR
jgi:hypothetical protein